MAEVEEACGREVADELADLLHGLQLYVPKVVREGTALDKLEPATAERVVEAFGGSTIYISRPRGAPVDRDEIERLIRSGLTVQQVALMKEVSERHILRLRASDGRPKILALPDPRQLRMFGDD